MFGRGKNKFLINTHAKDHKIELDYDKLPAKEKVKRALLNLLPKGLKSLRDLNDKDQNNKYLISKKTEVLKAKIMLNHILGACIGVGHGWL